MSVTPQPFPSGLRCVQVIRKGEVSCCWICTTCKDNEYVQDEFTCKACELGWWPDDDLAGRRRDMMLLFLGDCSSLSSVTLIHCTPRPLLLERTIRTVHTSHLDGRSSTLQGPTTLSTLSLRHHCATKVTLLLLPPPLFAFW